MRITEAELFQRIAKLSSVERVFQRAGCITVWLVERGFTEEWELVLEHKEIVEVNLQERKIVRRVLRTKPYRIKVVVHGADPRSALQTLLQDLGGKRL